MKGTNKQKGAVRLLSVMLVLIFVIAAVCACGNSGGAGNESTSGNTSREDAVSDISVTDLSRAGQSDFVREQLTMAVGPATSLTPWGTSNKTPGAVEVYETLYGQDGDGNDFPLLADATRGGDNEMGIAGCDHPEGKNEYLIYIWDNITDHAGNHITADDVVCRMLYNL